LAQSSHFGFSSTLTLLCCCPSILNHKFSIIDHQSSIFNPHFSFLFALILSTSFGLYVDFTQSSYLWFSFALISSISSTFSTSPTSSMSWISSIHSLSSVLSVLSVLSGLSVLSRHLAQSSYLGFSST
jgi:hypothetical protein